MVGILTVITDEKKNLKDFYDSLFNQTYKDYKLYAVDNNSIDGSEVYLNELNKDNSLRLKYIKLDYNSGFSGGSNIAAEEAIKDGCEYIFIINNDVVMEKDCIDELVKVMNENKDVSCAGLLLMRHKTVYPGVIQELGGKINFKRGDIEKYYTNSQSYNLDLPITLDTDFVGGGVCFVRSDVFKSVGMFDANYFAYFDEIDLSYRLKVLNNYKMLVTSKAIAYHNHPWSKKNKRSYYFEYYLTERNKYLFFRKYKMFRTFFSNLIIDSFKFPWRLLWFMKVCDFTLGIYYLRGLFAGLFNKSGKPKLKFVK